MTYPVATEFRNTAAKNQVKKKFFFQAKIARCTLERPGTSKNHKEIGNILKIKNLEKRSLSIL